MDGWVVRAGLVYLKIFKKKYVLSHIIEAEVPFGKFVG